MLHFRIATRRKLALRLKDIQMGLCKGAAFNKSQAHSISAGRSKLRQALSQWIHGTFKDYAG
jgi:hypothetical protein